MRELMLLLFFCHGASADAPVSSPSSLRCQAAGVCPDRAETLWTEDAELVHEDVAHGDGVSSPDGSFHTAEDSDPVPIKPDDLRIECSPQVSDMKSRSFPRAEKPTDPGGCDLLLCSSSAEAVVGIVAVGLVALFVFIITRFIRNKAKSFGQIDPSEQLYRSKEDLVLM